MGVVLRLSCATAMLASPLAAWAQTPGSAELDPTAPLDPMPDIGVEWPNMNAPDATVPAADGAETPAPAVTIDAAEERRYSVIIEGLQGIEDEPVLAKSFDEQSAL